MRRRGNAASGVCFAAFGAGLLVATLCPAQVILVFAAAALVLTGLCMLSH